MPNDLPDHGTLIQRCDLPAHSGMDAIEGWIVLLQEVPPQSALRFYAVRGAQRDLLTDDAALSILREYVPPKPITALSSTELMMEVAVLRAEMDRMRPIYIAAKAWREHRRLWTADETANDALASAIDAVVTQLAEVP